MSKTKQGHTPGPWKIDTYNGGFLKIVKDSEPDELPGHRLMADAQLVEAAPDMYEALKLVHMGLIDLAGKPPGKLTIQTLLKEVGEVLAKAKGEDHE